MIAARLLHAVALFACLATSALAQQWPQRPVKIFMPLPAGTGADAGLRIYVDRLQQMWGQGVVVENRPGAEGVLAVSTFVKARDDHALLYSYGGPITISPFVTKDLPYDPAKDLVPITVAAENVLGIAATANLPFSNFRGLADYAKNNPGKINWTATPGLPQFVFAAFGKSQNLDMAYVPYRDAGPALQDLKTGRIQLYVTGVGTFRPLLQSGEAKMIAVLNRARFSEMADVETVSEAGFPQLAGDGFNGFFGNADMKPELRDRIARDVATIANEPAMRGRLAALSQAPRAEGPQAFAEMIAVQSKQVAEIVRVIGVPGQ
jgi:tripartite-type tricarboxylate transporter receptor subunit TctC